MTSPIVRICHTFETRLQTLTCFFDKAIDHWCAQGKSPEDLLKARLAEDMLPLVYQIAYTCEQPRQFAFFCEGSAGPTLDPTGWTTTDARAAIEEAVRRTQAIANDSSLLERPKRIQLQGGVSFDLSGGEYAEEWLMPNFYFHLVTAYGVLRHLGAPLGKVDYMNHIGPYIRRGQTSPL